MVKQRTYGKKRGGTLADNYNKFAADSSGNEDSPEQQILREMCQNAMFIGPAEIQKMRERIAALKSPSDLATQDAATTKPTSHLSVAQGKKAVLASFEEASKPKPQLWTYMGPDIVDSSPRQFQVITPRGMSPKKTKSQAPATDDLSTLFTSLQLNSTPESSVVCSQTPISEVQPEPLALPSQLANYLQPILTCKNVSPSVSEFGSWMNNRTQLEFEKVGEGSFGEVFRATSPNGEAVILKLMPLNAEKGRGSRSFTSIVGAANEIKLLERMQRVPGFVEFRGACVLQGSLPGNLVQLWKDYKNSGRTVESRDPSKKTSYTPDQLWLLLEMSDAGRNLEPGQYAPPGATAVKGTRYIGLGRTWDIFWQVVKSIAKAEHFAQFEHRDLHLGNICAWNSTIIPDEEDLEFVRPKNPFPMKFNKTGTDITIIDYSLSRAFVQNEDDVLFYDFNKDKHIFKGEGDLQYDMYRFMAAAIGSRSPREFVPTTNVVWLWYLLNRLLAITKELSTQAKIKRRGCITKEARMLEILNEVQELTDPEHMKDWMVDSAASLLGLGLEKGWLWPQDVLEQS